jgi:hypothetical protein
MQKIKIWFTDFWPVFDQKDNFLITLLRNNYDIVLDEKEPDFLFYSNFGVEFKKYNCVKIFFTGENVRPDFNECDYSFSFDYSDNERNYRLPLYLIYDDIEKLTEKKPPFDEIIKQKNKFCNFVYSNPGNPFRNKFFKKLSKYKKIDSAGRLYNNTKFYANSKLELIKNYKFTISIENESYPGYTTEKIFEPMLAHSMPVYWGNPLIEKDFNTNSFVNIHNFDTTDDAIDFIIELDRDESKYYKLYKEPYLKNNIIPDFAKIENIYKRFDLIFNSNIIPVSDSTPAASSSRLEKNLWMTESRINYFQNAYKEKISNFSLLKLQIKLLKLLEK